MGRGQEDKQQQHTDIATTRPRAELVKINAYPQPKVYAYIYTSYKSPEILTLQTFFTRKEMLRKTTFKIELGYFSSN